MSTPPARSALSRFYIPFAAGLAALSTLSSAEEPKYDFPIYKNKSSGRQLSGAHKPAETPALSPNDAQKKFTVPEGFEMRLFAAEPMVVNPVAMSWDERGRLWVLELYEYPLGAPKGEKPRDRIKILEDTDADGSADKVHVWADGFSLATGLALGNGGAYLGQAPHLLHLKDTDGDDHADKTEIVLTGFGLEDRHELLNGFAWGPTGHLYMTHGVFTRSKVRDPNDPNDDGVLMTAAVARFDPRSKRFEIFAEGTSNPWGVDFDAAGNAYVSACVIEHLFHMAPGGLYDRQAGSPPHPYAYELLHAINDHKHHMAAYAGIQVYQGDQYPEEHRGTILQGNIHDNAVHQDALEPRGSSFTASKLRDLVRANDGWFMPVSTQVGPDGCVWIMDWYDRYPCYQNANADPDGVDRERGRIWRVVYTGKESGKPVPSRPQREMDLAKLPLLDLAGLLQHPNVWHRRQAQRLLQEKRDPAEGERLRGVYGMCKADRLPFLWTLHAAGLLDREMIQHAAEDSQPALRAWAARVIGERGSASAEEIALLRELAGDKEAPVRLAAVTAVRQLTSGALTVNTKPAQEPDPRLGAVLARAVAASADAKDPVIPFMIWHAAEPLFARDPKPGLEWLEREGAKHMPLCGTLAWKAMRRLCDLRTQEAVDLGLGFIARASRQEGPLAEFALDGLLKGLDGSALLPSSTAEIEELAHHKSPKIVELARKLGVLVGNEKAMLATLAIALDPNAAEAARIEAVRSARKLRTAAAREAMLSIVRVKTSEALAVEVIRALGEIGGDDVGEALLKNWAALAPAAQRTAAETLASRGRWTLVLLNAIDAKTVAASSLPATVLRTLLNQKEEALARRVRAVIGLVREPDADKAKIIAEKREVALTGEPDIKRGRELALATCLQCHKLHGDGAEVGPDLTGVGRSSLDALLANVIDTNQLIGAGYENTVVITKDGRLLNGRLMEQTDARVRLLSQGPKEEVIARKDISSMTVAEVSVMPEGLENIPDADLRDVLWFILAPPQEGPLTPERKRQLAGGSERATSSAPPARVDRESVALWNPQWRVVAPDFEGTPARLPEFAERRNVLTTHPFDREKPAALEGMVELPAGRKSSLRFAVAAHEQGDWELRVLADGKLLHKRAVTHDGERWKSVSVDLSALAGKKTLLRLENAASGWSWEFGYWSAIEIQTGE